MRVVPYPERFHAATRVGASAGARSFFSDETRLLLYALEKQATKGAREKVSEANEDINEFDGDVSEDVRRAMDETWKQLGTMSREEAMRLYVKVMDEEKPRWYESVDGECVGRTNKGMHGKTGERALPRALRALSEGKWEFCEYRGKKPLPRFQHAACALKSKMYVIGGSFRGRFMEDTHELDLDARDGGMEWRALKTKLGSEALPACAGHRAIAADGSVFVVGGRFKNAESMYMSVYKMTKPKNDVDEVIWEKIQTHGDDAPCSRRGASVTMVGEHKCIVFGGEDNDRRFLNDVWILDMTSFVWREVKAPGGHPPEPRAEHSAAMWGPDTLLVFGGTGKSTRCFNSLHALDLAHQKWMDVKPTGSTPPPRAGHAGILLKDGRYWCHVGGGNNERGLNECSVLDLEEMTWISRPDALEAPPVVGEGMTLCVLSTQDGREDVVIAFGGYNGATQNETQLLRVPRDFPEHVLVERTATPAVRAEVVTEGNAELRKENAEIASSTRERVSSSSFETISDAPLAASKSNAELRKENVELHRALHRARADAKIIADAHEKLRVKCDDYERTAREDAQKITELTAKLRTFQTSASDELVRSRAA